MSNKDNGKIMSQGKGDGISWMERTISIKIWKKKTMAITMKFGKRVNRHSSHWKLRKDCNGNNGKEMKQWHGLVVRAIRI